MAPQRRGVVPPKVEARLAELAELARRTDEQLHTEVVDAIKAGGSYREVQRITGIQMSTLQRWVKAAGGLPRAEADRAYHAERRRLIDEMLGPVRAELDRLDQEHRGEA